MRKFLLDFVFRSANLCQSQMPRRKATEFPLILRNKAGGRVKIYPQKNRDKQTFIVEWNAGTGRKREARTELPEAKLRATEILSDWEAGRLDRTEISVGRLLYLQTCEEKLGGSVPLMDAVDFYLAHNRNVQTSLDARIVAEQYLDAQRRETRSDRHLQTIEYHLDHFKKAMHKPIRSITADDIDQYLTTCGHTGRTRKNYRITLIAMFNWARNKGYVSGVKTAAELSQRPNVIHTEPGILTPSELRKVLTKADEQIIPFLVIGAFCGIRHAEIRRLTWGNILWDDKLIVLSRSATKTKKRRTALIKPNLMTWLERWKDREGLIVRHGQPHKLTKRAADAAGIDWPHNALRHSYITYAMALERNAAAVAEQCGNSEGEVQRSYKALATEAQAREWFSIFPGVSN